MATYSYQDLSTGHLRREDLLLAEAGLVFARVVVHEFGAWVVVPEEDDDEKRRTAAPSLQACIEFARETGSRWINFDRDGDREPQLPFYDW